MADLWFVQRDGQRFGPYSPAHLKQMTTTGHLLPVDLVARGEEGRWLPASQIKGLFAAAPAKQPPPIKAPPPLTTGVIPPVPFSFDSGPPPLPVSTPTGGTAVEIVDSKKLPTNPVAEVVGKLLGAKGLLPARIAKPVLAMLLVVGSGLCLSLFGVKVAFFDDSDLRNQLLIAFSLFHCVFAVVAIVLTARLQYSLAAPVAAVLTMTAWGWYCFATIPPIVSILGLMAGISLGAWALFTFRSPDVKEMFADAGKPGPLDRFGTPFLAGAAGGLLAVILSLGGVLYMVARDKTNTNYATSGGYDGGRQMKERKMKSRSGPGGVSWTDKAFKVTGEKKDPSFKPAASGSRQDFFEAIQLLSERVAKGPIRSGQKFGCYFKSPGCEASVWHDIFGEPQMLPRGRERIGRVENEFDRWRVQCTDGSVTAQGRIMVGGGKTYYMPANILVD
jgi:hypothetical protein